MLGGGATRGGSGSSSNQELGTAATRLGNTKRPQPTLMGAQAVGLNVQNLLITGKESNINGFQVEIRSWAHYENIAVLLTDEAVHSSK